MKVWLLTWEGTAGPAVDSDRKLVSILSSRTSNRDILCLVDQTYCRNYYDAQTMAAMANKRKDRHRQFIHVTSTSNRIFYGRNPCIFARVVSNFRVVRGPEEEFEHLSWVDPPYLVMPNGATLPVEKEPATSRELARRASPNGIDLAPNKRIESDA